MSVHATTQPRAARHAAELPPGQRATKDFPRFGTHLHRPPPAIPADPAIEIAGAVTASFSIPLADLATLPRVERHESFHCVAGWSATGLRWEGVTFKTFYRTVIEPKLRPEAAVTHIVFGGLDGYRSIVTIDDALAEDVLIADRLDGRPLPPDHGAPVRLVSPSQYGYMSTKHLCRIEPRTTDVTQVSAAHPFTELVLRGPLVRRHPRARVWHEERHPLVSARIIRPIYRALIPPIRWISARGSRPETH